MMEELRALQPFLTPQEREEIDRLLNLANQANQTEAIKNSLLAFTRHTMPHFQVAAHHRLICEALERVATGHCKRLMIFAPPRHTKSEIASRRFPAWYIGNNSNKQIITATYSSEYAADFGRDVRNIVAGDEFASIFGNVSLRNDSKAANRWHTNNGGVYVAAGVGGPITGRGAHIALIDDPFKDRQDADSATMREKVWHWYTNVLYTRLMPGGAIVLIMTRWHSDDLAGRLLAQQAGGGDQWEVVTLPAIAEADDILKRPIGEPLWPEWYGIEVLQQIRRVLTINDGPRAWAALYQQKPVEEHGNYFKANYIRWYEYGNAPKHLRIYAASDYAVSEGKGDFTVHGIIGIDPADRIYVLDWWRKQAASDEWVESAIDLALKWKPIYWAEEKGQILGGVGPFLDKRMRERHAYFARSSQDGLFASVRDKATRARSIQGRMSMGMVYFPKDAPWVDELISEVLRFSGEGDEVDDQVDVLSLFGRMLDTMYKGSVPQHPRNMRPDSAEFIMDQIKQMGQPVYSDLARG